jgi:hypothetical protein
MWVNLGDSESVDGERKGYGFFRGRTKTNGKREGIKIAAEANCSFT